jgi:dihydrofolate synthase/folylpolyglutamate synthase
MSGSLQDYFDSFQNWETRLKDAGPNDLNLDHMEQLLTLFGRPDDRLKFVHVAGSKGKGSTCAFLASILRAAGYRVGLYTSPHLHNVRERIRVLEPFQAGSREQGAGSGGPANRGRQQLESGATASISSSSELQAPCSMPFEGMITADELTDRVNYYRGPVDEFRRSGGRVTFYEFMTALAISYFAAKQVNIVILETGLGGRLDATNAVDTMVCGITPIGLEHTNILGDTLGKIAFEKACIVKMPSQKVVLAPQAPEAKAVLEARCRMFGIIPTTIGQNMPLRVTHQGAEGVVFDVEGRRHYPGLCSKILGAHQAVNATTAIAMAEDLEIFGFCLTEEAVREGVAGAVWPARFEIVRRDPTVVLDCAHTPESAAALVETFQAVFPGRKAVLVFGSSDDKNVAGMARALAPIAQSVVLTKADNPRALDPDIIRAGADYGAVTVVVRATASLALKEALAQAGQDGIILVAGSIFLAAEVRSLLLSGNK